MILFSILLPALMLLIADALGWIHLSAKPLTRVLKWLCFAVWAWFLPLLLQQALRFQIDPVLWTLWKLIILGALLIAMVTSLICWLVRFYGPLSEGQRRCKKCRQPVLNVLLECPHCRTPLQSA